MAANLFFFVYCKLALVASFLNSEFKRIFLLNEQKNTKIAASIVVFHIKTKFLNLGQYRDTKDLDKVFLTRFLSLFLNRCSRIWSKMI